MFFSGFPREEDTATRTKKTDNSTLAISHNLSEESKQGALASEFSHGNTVDNTSRTQWLFLPICIAHRLYNANTALRHRSPYREILILGTKHRPLDLR